MRKAALNQYSRQILIAALLLGAILRWLQIDARSFWYDEALSSLIAGMNVSQILANAAATDHPPGYYLLLHFWLALGRSEFAIRSLSAIFSWGAIPLLYGLARRLFDKPTAAIAALAMAVLPFQIYFAQETRMYGPAIFLATALMWIFVAAVSQKNRWPAWLGYAAVAALGLYVHYYFAFLLLGLHLWLVFARRLDRTLLLPLVLANGLAALLFLPQLQQALTRTGAYLGGVAWQASPHALSPLTTLYYLLFAHRSPVWVFPIGLFLMLTALILTPWESRRRPQPERQLELVLWFSIVTPIAAVLLISWLVRPIYLERSFAVSSPALVLLLTHGAMAAPRRSPTPHLAGLLIIPVAATLLAHLATPDPAKPPLREAAQTLAVNFAPGDASLHLQDASFMPATWYAPQTPHFLVNVPGAAWTVAQTHRLFGGDVVEWQTAVAGANRLWLTVMPGYTGPEQQAAFQQIDARYPRLNMWDWGAVQLYLYDLQGSK